MRLRNLLLTLTTGLLLANCAEDIEKQAQPYLLRAQQSYANQQYALAKLQIDSIKQLYPKAFETRTQAQALLIDVELAEVRTGKSYIPELREQVQQYHDAFFAELENIDEFSFRTAIHSFVDMLSYRFWINCL